MRRRLRAPELTAIGLAAALALIALARPAAADPDPWWGRDKALHFGASASIAAYGYGIGAVLDEGYGTRLVLGSSLALAVGASKELLDLAGTGDPSFRDLTWDVIGAAVGLGISLGIDLAIHGTHPPRPHPR